MNYSINALSSVKKGLKMNKPWLLRGSLIKRLFDYNFKLQEANGILLCSSGVRNASICQLVSRDNVVGKRGISSGICKEITMTHAWGELEQGYSCNPDKKALVLGIYSTCDDPDNDKIYLTRTALKYNQYTDGMLLESVGACGNYPLLGEVRLLYNMDPQFPVIAVVGLGSETYGYNRVEQRDEFKEAIRIAVGAGCKAVQALNISKVYVESFGHAESAAEGAALALWTYQDLKNRSKKMKVPLLGLYDDCDFTGWEIGLTKASAQNLARQLMETPSNLMTPTAFALSAIEVLCKCGVNIEVRVKEWAEEMSMGAFLAVTKGSKEPPIFLEVSYNGCDPCCPPIALVGKGITFDSGGLCLKSCEDMLDMRGDMAGAACVVSTVRAVATLGIPINIRAIIPLCENMPGASATKPGDIVCAMNGKSICIQNTDYEGTLILADALSYAQRYMPSFILDVGTLTKQMRCCLGSSASGCFSNDEGLWKMLKGASVHTGDRLWRMPLWECYNHDIFPSHLRCDLTNASEEDRGRTCTTAAFLKQFTCNYRWVHIDTFGVMTEDGNTPYLRCGMSGRPTRTIIEFLAQLACSQCVGLVP